jgi:hypothetical protein
VFTPESRKSRPALTHMRRTSPGTPYFVLEHGPYIPIRNGHKNVSSLSRYFAELAAELDETSSSGGQALRRT